jgi:hypothetical protein
VELTRQVSQRNSETITDQRPDFCMLLAFSSAGLAEGAVDELGRPIWTAARALILGYEKIKRVSPAAAAERPIRAGVGNIGSATDVQRSNQRSWDEFPKTLDEEVAEMIVPAIRAMAIEANSSG